MRAITVNEDVNFERGKDPRKSMNIGINQWIIDNRDDILRFAEKYISDPRNTKKIFSAWNGSYYYPDDFDPDFTIHKDYKIPYHRFDPRLQKVDLWINSETPNPVIKDIHSLATHILIDGNLGEEYMMKSYRDTLAGRKESPYYDEEMVGYIEAMREEWENQLDDDMESFGDHMIEDIEGDGPLKFYLARSPSGLFYEGQPYDFEDLIGLFILNEYLKNK